MLRTVTSDIALTIHIRDKEELKAENTGLGQMKVHVNGETTLAELKDFIKRWWDENGPNMRRTKFKYAFNGFTYRGNPQSDESVKVSSVVSGDADIIQISTTVKATPKAIQCSCCTLS